MTYVRSCAASALRILAARLDGMETVRVNNIHHEISIYTASDVDPEDIALQIKYHLGLHEVPVAPPSPQ